MRVRETLLWQQIMISCWPITATTAQPINANTTMLKISSQDDCLIRLSKNNTACTTTTWTDIIWLWRNEFPINAWNFTYYSICKLDWTAPNCHVIQSY